LLEAKGTRALAENTKTVDAFSFWRRERPFIFLNLMKTPERSRLDAAHELAHLVLDRHGGPQGRRAEEEAKRFCVLLPDAICGRDRDTPSQQAGRRPCPLRTAGSDAGHHAWRKNVSGIVQAPLPLFWGVSKTA
jgi:IrrE N-terminal-like domain